MATRNRSDLVFLGFAVRRHRVNRPGRPALQEETVGTRRQRNEEILANDHPNQQAVSNVKVGVTNTSCVSFLFPYT